MEDKTMSESRRTNEGEFVNVSQIIKRGLNPTFPNGVLADSNWKTVSLNKGLDQYEVEHGDKKITVLAEMHETSEAINAFNSAIATANTDPDSWVLLIEGMSTRDKEKLLNYRGIKYDLPGKYIPYADLIKERPELVPEIASLLIVENLDSLGKLIKAGLLPKDKKPLQVAYRASEIILNGFNIHFKREEVDELFQKIIQDDQVLQRAIDTTNSFDHLTVLMANEKQAKTVQDALQNQAKNYLIIIGKAHLGALVGTGEFRTRTENDIKASEISLSNVQTALSFGNKNPDKTIQEQDFISYKIARLNEGLARFKAHYSTENPLPSPIAKWLDESFEPELRWLENDPQLRYREFNYGKSQIIHEQLIRSLIEVARNNRDADPAILRSTLQDLVKRTRNLTIGIIPEVEQLIALARSGKEK